MTKKYQRHGHNRTREFGGKTKEYMAWESMKSRCQNPENPKIADYGNRGICVCQRWQLFSLFLNDMGPAPPRTTLERRDNDRGYDRDNCYWATSKQQANNRRSCVSVTIDGVTKTATEWCDQLKIVKNHRALTRIKRDKWDPVRAIMTPCKPYTSRV